MRRPMTPALRAKRLRNVDPHRMFVHQPATQVAGQSDHPGSRQRQEQPPWGNDFRRLVETQQPVQRSQRKQHDGNEGVAPGIDEPANVRHRQQIDNTHQARHPPAKRPNACQPEPGSIPKRVPGDNITEVYRDQSYQRCNREVDQERVQGVTANGGPADNWLLLGWHRRLLRGLGFGIPHMLPAPARLTSILTSAASLSACSGPHSILDPASPSAQIIAKLWWGMFIWFSLVLFAVFGLWLYAIIRKKPTATSKRSQRHGQRWILGGGVILPLVSIGVLLAFGLPLGHLTLPENERIELRIDVVGHQWWWEIRYPETGVVTANQLHIPADRTVQLNLTASDVIHAFWVPRLGGKLDMIPGTTNTLRLRADQPGTYHGHCAEFCGLQHAHMGLVVKAQTAGEFEDWLAARQEPPDVSPEHEAAVADFQALCGRCHRVKGISAGTEGPDLTDIGSRSSLGAGALPQIPGAMLRWLQEHQALKPGNRMPAQDEVPAQTLAAIADWLETLNP